MCDWSKYVYYKPGHYDTATKDGFKVCELMSYEIEQSNCSVPHISVHRILES